MSPSLAAHAEALLKAGRAKVYCSYGPQIQHCDVLAIDGQSATIKWDRNGSTDMVPLSMLHRTRA